jgi:beta-lactamase class A
MRRSPLAKLIAYLLRMVILGIGVGAIAGTVLSVIAPNGYRFQPASAPNPPSVASATTISSAVGLPSALKLSQEITPLKQSVMALAAQNPGLTFGVFLEDLDSGVYLDINGTRTFAAASMIKVPVLVAFFQDVDAGKIALSEKLTMRKDLIASEAGSMQYQPVGTKFSALETATQMIVVSDNTATNMLIDRLGGIENLNERFRAWGLTNTEINNPLPDLKGTNISTPRDFANLMALVSQGKLLSMKSRDRMLAIMRQTVTNTLLPQGLGDGATISHKTGDIGTFVGDVGLIDMPNGKRYVATAIVKRPFNDPRAQELIRQTSRAAYKYLNTTAPASPTPTQAPIAAPNSSASAASTPSSTPLVTEP